MLLGFLVGVLLPRGENGPGVVESPDDLRPVEILQPSLEQKEEFESALASLRQFDLEAAIPAFEQLLAEDAPIHGLAYVAARASLLDGDHDRAIELSQQSVAGNEYAGEALGLQALAEFRKRRQGGSLLDPNHAALTKLAEAAGLAPLDPQIYLAMAEVHRQNGSVNPGHEAALQALNRMMPMEAQLVAVSRVRISALESGSLSAADRDRLAKAEPHELPTADLAAAALQALQSSDTGRAEALLAELERTLRPSHLRLLLEDSAFGPHQVTLPVRIRLDPGWSPEPSAPEGG